jgi:histidine triad (HIT) family protein
MSLDDAYDGQNIFAKIIRGEIPCAKVFEDDEIFAFMDAFPQARGHTLVISKVAEARNLLDIDPAALCNVILGVQRVARAVRSALNPDGLVIMQFNGAAAGQTVFHLHFHIIPRWDGVAITGHGQAGMANISDLQAIAKQITENISYRQK